MSLRNNNKIILSKEVKALYTKIELFSCLNPLYM